MSDDKTEDEKPKRKYTVSKKRHKKRGKYKRRTDKFGKEKVGNTIYKKHKRPTVSEKKKEAFFKTFKNVRNVIKTYNSKEYERNFEKRKKGG